MAASLSEITHMVGAHELSTPMRCRVCTEEMEVGKPCIAVGDAARVFGAVCISCARGLSRIYTDMRPLIGDTVVDKLRYYGSDGELIEGPCHSSM